MSNDGFAVGGACVVSSSVAPFGQSAIDVFFASQHVYFDSSLALPDILVGQGA